MTVGISSTLARRQLGRRLRTHREAVGKTGDDVVESGLVGRNKLWQIETGTITVKQGDVLALARLYRVTTAATDEMVALADATKIANFEEEYGASVPEWVGIYSDLETGAVVLSDYNPELLHGLLQTEAYARAVMQTEPTLTQEVVEQRVQFRMARQRAFFSRPTPGKLHVVVPEGVLRLVVGSAAVMEEQIAHLRAVDERDGVSVRVLPATGGAYSGMNGRFTILDFAEPDEDPSVVYLEYLVGSRYLERPDQVGTFRGTFGRMWERASPMREYVP